MGWRAKACQDERGASVVADTKSLRLIGFGLSAVTVLVALTAVVMVAQTTWTVAIQAAAQ